MKSFAINSRHISFSWAIINTIALCKSCHYMFYDAAFSSTEWECLRTTLRWSLYCPVPISALGFFLESYCQTHGVKQCQSSLGIDKERERERALIRTCSSCSAIIWKDFRNEFDWLIMGQLIQVHPALLQWTCKRWEERDRISLVQLKSGQWSHWHTCTFC